MRQRVRALHGEFSIGRRPEGGTVIEVKIPTATAASDGPPTAAAEEGAH